LNSRYPTFVGRGWGGISWVAVLQKILSEIYFGEVAAKI